MTTTPPVNPAAAAASIDAMIQAKYAEEGIGLPTAAPVDVPDYMPQPAPVAPVASAPLPVAVPVPGVAPVVAPAITAPAAPVAPVAPALAAPTFTAQPAAPVMTLTQAAAIVPANASPQQLAFLAQQAGTDVNTLSQFAAMSAQIAATPADPKAAPVVPVAAAPTPTPAAAPTVNPMDAQIAVAQMYEAIGGHAQWNAFAGYMEQAADPATLAAYKASSPVDQARIAAVYAPGFKANPPRRDVTQAAPVAGVPVVTAQSPTAVKAMFADPRYNTDPNFRAQAMAALVAQG